MTGERVPRRQVHTLALGCPPVPAKLAAKIHRWDFVEMGEVLPEFWVALRDGEGDNKQRQGRKVTDLCTWLQCYAIYVAVLGPHKPPGNPRSTGIHVIYHQCEPGS